MSGDAYALIHCSLARGAIWRPFIEAIRLDAEPIVIELQGHGKAPDWDPKCEISEQTLERALVALPPRAIPVIGHSYGALIALRLALEHPERVSALVMAEPVHFAAARGTPEFGKLMEHFAPYAEGSDDAEGAARRFIEIWGDGQSWEAIPPDRRRYFVERIHLITAAWSVQGEDAPGLLAPGRLEKIRVPVTLVEGGATDPVVRRINDLYETRIPDTERHVIPGAGHMAPITHAGIVAPLVRPRLAFVREPTL